MTGEDQALASFDSPKIPAECFPIANTCKESDPYADDGGWTEEQERLEHTLAALLLLNGVHL